MNRIIFSSEGNNYRILSDSVDIHHHPYFIKVSNLMFEDQSNLIISAFGDEARKRFGEVKELLIPLQQIQLVEVIESPNKKVTQLKEVVE